MSIGTPEEPWRLIADVGATNARFALCRSVQTIERIRVYPTSAFPGPEQAIRHYLQDCGQPAIRHAAIGMATPAIGDWVKMTNFPWEFSIEDTRNALGFKSLHVINDFTALAMALPFLPQDELVQVGGHQGIAGMPLSLIGPGTGLGVSGLIPAPRGGWTPVASEGGHASFSPDNEREMQLWREGRKEFGHVSVERLLSGAGLQFIYRNLCQLANEPAHDYSPADISNKAISNNCAQCRAALDAFCAILGTAAANVTLTFGARGGAYIGGGIIPKLGDYFAQSPFRARFEQHGRLSTYLEPIPVFVITSNHPAFIGAAAFLEELQHH